MKVFLIGYMGSGKSTMARKLAKELKYDFIDLDDLISISLDKTIYEIFEEFGEHYFHEIEQRFLLNTEDKEKTVIATGGGTPCFYDNMDWMNSNGITIYFRMSAGALYHRLALDENKRPRLKAETDIDLVEQIVEDLTRREHIYLRAKHVLKGETLNIAELVELIKKQDKKVYSRYT